MEVVDGNEVIVVTVYHKWQNLCFNTLSIKKANDLGDAYITAKPHRMPYKQFPCPGADGAHHLSSSLD
jgi:hypothetical protein